MLTSKQSSQASGCRVTGLGRSLLFISQCLLAGAVSAETHAPELFSFEGYSVPGYVQHSESSSVSTNVMQFIHGQQSLSWSWTDAGATVTITPDNSIAVISDSDARAVLGRPATHVLSFWIYNEQAIDKNKPLTVMVNGKVGAKVDVSLDFTGWRTFGVSIINDLKFNGNINSLVFQAPETSSGSILVDRVMFSIDDSRYQWSDYHIQIDRHPFTEIDFNITEPPPQATPSELAGVNDIYQRTLEYLVDSNVPTFREMQSKYAELHLDDNLTRPLRHIITDKQQVIYQPDSLVGNDKLQFDEYVVLGDKDDREGTDSKVAGYAKLMLNIGTAYHQDAFQAHQDELAEMYIKLTEHLLDQGFFQGSALVTTHHWGYSGRWWYLSALLMADQLEQGIRNKVYDALVWYSREFKESFDMVAGPESSNMDYFNTLSIQHLTLLLLEPDEHRRVALIRKFSDFIGESLAQTPPGFSDGFRPDGTAWRHKGNYPGYSFSAMDNVAKVVYFLDDSPFSVSDAGKANLKKAMMAGWLYTNPIVGLGNSGRHPFTGLGIKAYDDGIKYLALSGNPESGDSIDEELASIYLEVTGKTAQDGQSIFGRSIDPATLPEGHWSFNGGAFGIHRYGDTMVTLKAYNSNVWSSEIYAADNRYGRYQSHGGVQIMPYGNPESFGYKEDGWNWNRNPGATTIHLDWDVLESPNSGTLMVFSEEAFSGSASLDNEFGLFAFKHKAPDRPNFDPTFVARKSVLAIGNRLIMLGSDISNTGSGTNRTETTLFQHAITDDSMDTWINGEKISTSDHTTQLGEHDWLIDGMGNGYLIAGNSIVEMRRQQQSSRHNKTKEATFGHFASAWIDHGVRPDKAGYAYQVILDTTPQEMETLSLNQQQGNPGYQVLRKDNQFHIVHDQDSGVTGYVAFEGGETSHSLITHIDKPALAMVRTLSTGRLSLTAVSPGLTLNHEDDRQSHQPVDVTVTVDGLWELVEDSQQGIQLNKLSDSTEVTFTSDFGQSKSIELKPEGEESVTPTPPPSEGGGEGGGAIEWMTLLALLFALAMRKKPGIQ
ncbi:chondroitinase family polysaccharide lyase [Endozoicomonas atrinae]|uniref:chondroitinase family polysaccharide lyase n=1 Tax=Endozoicomonas atrinae TaxID=1333660 RepID=UPI000A6328C5|nr:chondroitinase family polysaccharide lyase [Endozoicomonas atrinae]